MSIKIGKGSNNSYSYLESNTYPLSGLRINTVISTHKYQSIYVLIA